jgi:hypothetical protein
MNEVFQNPLVTVAVIGFLQAVTLTLLSWMLSKISKVKKDGEATRDQIVNDHPKTPNFREENDRRHEETRGWFTTLFKQNNTITNRLDKHGELLDELTTGFLQNRERIEDIEQSGGGKK